MFSELEEIGSSGNAMKRSYQDFNRSKTVSPVSKKSSYSNFPDSIVQSSRNKAERQRQLGHDFNKSKTVSSVSKKSSYNNVPESIVRSSRTKSEQERQLDGDFLELEDTISRNTVETEEAYNSSYENVEKLGLKDSKLRSMTEQKDLGAMQLNERKTLENFKLRDKGTVSGRTEDETNNKQTDEMGKSSNELSNKTLEIEDRNKPGVPNTNEKKEVFIQNENRVTKQSNNKDFYAPPDRILKNVLKLEEQRKISGSLKSEQTNAANSSSKDAIVNKQVNKNEFLEFQDKVKVARKTMKPEDESSSRKKSVSQTTKADEKNKVSVLLEDNIFNKHERQLERQEMILKALDVKIELDATQKSELEELVERLLSPMSDDDNQEDIIFVKASEKEILEARARILGEFQQMEKELDERQKSELAKSMKVQPISKCQIDIVDDCQAETRIPLMDETTVSADLNDKSEGDEKRSVDINLTEILKESRDRRNVADASKTCSSCKSIVLSFFCIAVLSIVPIYMIVIGSLYHKQCPVQPYIPIYLVVGGAFGTFYNCVSVFRRRGKKASYTVFDGIINLFLVIWFIIGCVWVYGVEHVEFYDTTDPDYCQKLCYNFAYWLFNVIFILIGASVGLGCCAFCCYSARKCWKKAHGPVPVGYSRREWRRAQGYF